MDTYDRRNSTSITFRTQKAFKARMNRTVPRHFNTRTEFLHRIIEEYLDDVEREEDREQ